MKYCCLGIAGSLVDFVQIRSQVKTSTADDKTQTPIHELAKTGDRVEFYSGLPGALVHFSSAVLLSARQDYVFSAKVFLLWKALFPRWTA